MFSTYKTIYNWNVLFLQLYVYKFTHITEYFKYYIKVKCYKGVNTLYYLGVSKVKSKIKTSILIDKDVWERFKEKVLSERSLKELSKAVEEAIMEELVEVIVLEEIEQVLPRESIPLSIEPVRPRIKTHAEKIVREMRDSRT